MYNTNDLLDITISLLEAHPLSDPDSVFPPEWEAYRGHRFFQALSPDEIAKFIRNTKYRPSITKRLACPDFHLGNILSSGFYWASSPEGFGYWDDIFIRISPFES